MQLRSGRATRPAHTPSHMTDSALETVLRRDRWIVGGAIAVIVALAWAYVLWLAQDMDMGGMDMTASA